VAAVLAACGPQTLEQSLSECRVHLRQGDAREALETAERARRYWGASPSTESGWQVRLALADALIAAGEPARALEVLTPSAVKGSARIAAARLMHQGWAQSRLGHYPEALDLLGRALAAVPPGDTGLRAEIELRRVPILARLGFSKEGDEAGRRAVALARATADPYILAAALGNFGMTRLEAFREDEALPLFEEGLVFAQRAGARRFTAGLQVNLGRCYYGLGDFDRAVALLSSAERTSTELHDPHRAQVALGVLGDAHAELRGDLRSAAAYYRRALALARRGGDAYQIASQLRNLADLSLETGDLDAARQYQRQCAGVVSRNSLPEVAAWNLLVSARIAAAEGDSGAEAAYRGALAEASRRSYTQIAWSARAGLAEVLAGSRPAQARAEFETALRDVERTRSNLAREGWKLTFQERFTRFYRAYIDFLMAQGDRERALEIAEASRARLLAQKLRLDTEALDIVPAGRLRQLARSSGAVLVSYWLAPKKSYVWVVTPRGIESAELPGEAEITPLVGSYAAAIEGGRDPLATANAAGERLAALLLAPLRNKGSRFVVVPVGALHRLILESLPAAPGRYWIEDATVVLAPSLALLSDRPAAAPGRERMLLIGNPEQPAPEYPPLPAGAEEFAAIRKHFQPEVHEGAAAHPGAYLEARPERFSLIHLSAHAVANRQAPLESAVILSRRDDRFKLYAREVIEIPIRARLVTISACRSAGARVYSGEGLVGFTWAFLRSGAQNVVAGLWDVNDASSARLMGEVYANIAAGQSPSQALRGAKMALLQSGSAWRKPFYWAPFQIFSRIPKF
jgi:CHAT domain-containing protein